MIKPNQRQVSFIQQQRIARMATVDELGKPYIVPICYAFDGVCIFSAIDHKPKRIPIMKLKRIRNIQANSDISLVIDRYHEDWSKLAYILIHGSATIIARGPGYRAALALLTEKYRQYREISLAELELPVIQIVPSALTAWGDI